MHPMNDSLDDEITRALAVEPSPEFLARVRTRIAAEPAPRAYRPWWLLGSAAAACAVVVVAVALWPRALRPGQIVSRTALSATSTSGIGTLVSTQQPVLPAREARRRERDRRSPEPEVLIAAGEVRAMRALILAARDGRLELAPSLENTAVEAASSPPIETIDIQPITIAPIAPFSGEEGVRQ